MKENRGVANGKREKESTVSIWTTHHTRNDFVTWSKLCLVKLNINRNENECVEGMNSFFGTR